MSAKFPEFLEKITFHLEFTEETQSATDPAAFLAAIEANEDLLATRLAGARVAVRETGLKSTVSLDGMTWTRPGRSWFCPQARTTPTPMMRTTNDHPARRSLP